MKMENSNLKNKVIEKLIKWGNNEKWLNCILIMHQNNIQQLQQFANV